MPGLTPDSPGYMEGAPGSVVGAVPSHGKKLSAGETGKEASLLLPGFQIHLGGSEQIRY